MNDFDNKNVLITGATGLIGSNLANYLYSKTNARLFLLGRSIKKMEQCFSDIIDSNRVVFIESDVCDFDLSPKDYRFDYIFHAAGPMERKIIENSPTSVINPNIVGAIKLLNYLLEQEKQSGIKGRFILFSSVTVYGNRSEENRVVCESDTGFADTLDSTGACYSESKRMSEVIVNAYCKQYGVDVVIARFSTVYGYTYFVPDTAFYNFVKCYFERQDIKVISSKLFIRDNIYIEDAIEGLVYISIKGESGEAYNISSNGDLGNLCNVAKIACIFEEAGKEDGVAIQAIVNDNAVETGSLSLNNEKLKALGWECKTGLREGIKQTLSLYKSRLSTIKQN